MAQAATGDPAATYAAARLTGRQLRAFGVNTNFAPVLDVNNNPANPVINTRSFGEDPAAVARLGRAALRGYAEAQVIATAKHFPGHGDTSVDSHLGLPVVRHDRARLAAVELAPFRAAIGAGLPAIMTAHIIFEALDSVPATLSRAILTDLLRGELGFDGVIFTDALEMDAIADAYDPAEAALRSKAAGADVLLPLGPLESQIEVARALQAAIIDGRLPRESFEATARRLTALRRRFGVTHSVPRYAEPAPALNDIALKIAHRGITMTQRGSALPLPPDARLTLIDCVLPRFNLAEEALERAGLLRDLVRESFPCAESIVLSPGFHAAELPHALTLAERADAILFVSRNAAMIDEQQAVLKALGSLRVPLIHAAVRAPYDAALTPAGATALLTYGDPEASLRALVDVLAGRIEARGVQPVTLAAQAEAGA
jgi:beta-N-acetylhexosaminidase